MVAHYRTPKNRAQCDCGYRGGKAAKAAELAGFAVLADVGGRVEVLRHRGAGHRTAGDARLTGQRGEFGVDLCRGGCGDHVRPLNPILNERLAM